MDERNDPFLDRPVKAAASFRMRWRGGAAGPGQSSSRVSGPVEGDAALPAWVEEAMAIARRDALHASRVAWDDVVVSTRAHAVRALAAGFPERSLAPIFRALGDGHSFIDCAGASGNEAQDEGAAGTAPTVEVRPSGIAVLELPSMGDPTADSSCHYQQQGLETLASVEGADRLIVDLRANGGGNCYPMLAVLAPLLGPGRLVGWEDASGATDYVEYDGQALVRDDESWPTAASWPTPPERIAVLAGPATASSGEAALLTLLGRSGCRVFGAPTAGFTTANERYELSDGVVLYLAVARMVASTGEVFDGPIPPDVLTDDAAALDAAEAWLRNEPASGCV